MSVNGIVNTGSLTDTHAGHKLRFDSDAAFGSRLRVGEVLQGKVTRHFDGSRYAVNFGGSEKIVDSALPLTSGELIYGRVVGLDDKVHLKRVYPGGVQAEETRPPFTRSRNRVLLQELFTQYHAQLPKQVEEQVLSLMSGGANPALVALSSLILNKLGVAVEPILVRVLSKTLVGGRQANVPEYINAAPILKTVTESALNYDSKLIGKLASILAWLSDPRTTYLASDGVPGDELSADGKPEDNGLADTHEAGGNLGERSPGRDELLGRWILNAQNEGSVSHRLARIPIWFGGQLVEIDVAFFSQREATVKSDSVRHRKIVLSLQTEGLGRVEANIFVANRHLRLKFYTDNQKANDALATYLGEIKSTFDSLDWIVDEVSYAVQKTTSDGLMKSVAEHHIANDSLNRVM